MKRNSWLYPAFTFLTFFVLPGVPPAGAQTIPPGILVMTTSSVENTVWTGAFGSGLFGPGSDEITDARIFLQGVPLAPAAGPAALGAGDTIIKITLPVTFTSYPQTKGTRTRTLALSLRSVAPLTVTYGGTNPELWDMRVCLSNTPLVVPDGSMLLTNDCETAGTFSAVLTAVPKVILTRRRDGQTRVVDTGGSGGTPFVFTARGEWMLRSAAPDTFVEVSAGATIDANCDGTFETTLPASSEIVLGVGRVSCNALDPDQGFPQIQRINYELRQNLVLEPATRDDRSFPLYESSATPDLFEPKAALGLGVFAALGIGMVVIVPRRKGQEIPEPEPSAKAQSGSKERPTG